MIELAIKARELLETIRAEQRQRNERMLAVLGDLLSAAKEVDLAARNAPNPWTTVRRRHETGRAVLEKIESSGGLAGLVAEHEALAAFHGDNYLPLLDRFYHSHRGLLLRLAGVLVLEPASADRRLLEALEFVRATPPAPASSSATNTPPRRGPSARRRARSPP